MSEGAELERRIEALARSARCMGSLEAEEIARGAHLCWSNAVSLLGEARLLASHSRLARALSLTVLALEELGKPPLLWELDPSDDPQKWRSFWRERFSKHSAKQQTIGVYGQLLKATGYGIYDLQLAGPAIDALDRLKQWGFYVDCVGCTFQSPDELSKKLPDILDLLFAVAEERADSFAKFHASLEQSIWVYQRRLLSAKPGQFWPPPLRSEAEAGGHLLSLASQYSRSLPPDYVAFKDACEQLAAVAQGFSFGEVLVATGRRCYDRTHCSALHTAATRGFSMMKLFLGALPDQQSAGVLQEWKKR